MTAEIADSTRQTLLFSEVVESYACALKQLVEFKNNPKTIARDKAAHIQVTWSWVCKELLSLLLQYPGGVSEAVALTELSERWQEQGRSKNIDRSKSAFVPVRQLLRRQSECNRDGVTIEGTVRGIEGGSGLPIVMMLADSMTEEQPLGMYLHSRFHSLCSGPNPMLREGCKLRLGNCIIHRAHVSVARPVRLLPTEELAIVCASMPEAAALLGQHQPLTPTQVLNMTMEREESCSLAGVLHAVVTHIGPVEAGIDSGHGISSRSGTWRCIWLAELEGQQSDQRAVQLRLLDQQVAYGDMLQVGEYVLIRQPLLTATLGPGTQVCVEVGRDSLVFVVPADWALCGNTTKAPVQGSQINVDATCTLSSPAGHPVTGTGGVVVGLLISIVLQVQQQQRSLLMRIMDSGEAVYDVTAVLGPSSGNALLSMRAGQTVAATGLCAREPGQSAQEGVEASAGQASFSCVWAEGPGAMMVNLSALPSMLYSPAFHTELVSLASLREAAALQRSCCMPAICRVSITGAPSVVIRRVHAPCQKPLRRASFGFDEVFGGDEGGSEDMATDEAPSQSQPEYLATDNKSSLWTCSFCQSECGSFATAPVLEARLEITDEAGTTEQALAQGDAVAQLVGATALEWYGKDASAKESKIDALKGIRLMASIFREAESLEADSSLQQPLKIALVRILD
ncbi:hypothetical protein COCOBI_09-2910 [Coccomyxa sp. Obi]|nr:hypothetical protein COCOBI_09-2910 [Coccomyxa sp. Obi]